MCIRKTLSGLFVRVIIHSQNQLPSRWTLQLRWGLRPHWSPIFSPPSSTCGFPAFSRKTQEINFIWSSFQSHPFLFNSSIASIKILKLSVSIPQKKKNIKQLHETHAILLCSMSTCFGFSIPVQTRTLFSTLFKMIRVKRRSSSVGNKCHTCVRSAPSKSLHPILEQFFSKTIRINTMHVLHMIAAPSIQHQGNVHFKCH